MIAAITGATGLTGQHVLNLLLDGARYDPVVAIVRRPMHRNHPRLRESAGFPSIDRVDVALCCVGTTTKKAGSKDAFRAVDHGYVMEFARWAKERGARQFVFLSSVAAQLGSANFYLRVKAETERDLELLGFEALDIFQPSMLLGVRSEPRPLERVGQVIAEAMRFALAGPLERYRGIAAADVAKAMVAVTGSPGAGVRRYEWREIVELSGG
jgi:uncharacterized protein YbjT (DUF2867 family)